MSLRAKVAAMIIRHQMAGFYKDLSLEVQRAKMKKYARVIKLPVDVACEAAETCPVPAEWITTPGIDRDQVILYLHGGAFFLPYDKPHLDLVARLGRSARMSALLVDYRLAPEHPYPAALDDVITSYQWLLERGHSPTNLTIAGDSSGGTLTLAALLWLRDAGVSLPAAAVCLSPWTDLSGSGDSMQSNARADFINSVTHLKVTANLYAGDHDLRAPLISPLYADLAGLPPLLIQVGTKEVLLDDSTRLAERARSAGVDVTLETWTGMFHVFQLCAGLVPEARKAIDHIAAFLRHRAAER